MARPKPRPGHIPSSHTLRVPILLPLHLVPSVQPPKYTGLEPFVADDFYRTTGEAIMKATYMAKVIASYVAYILAQEQSPALGRLGVEVALAQKGVSELLVALRDMRGANMWLETVRGDDGLAYGIRKNPREKIPYGKHDSTKKDKLLDPAERGSLV